MLDNLGMEISGGYHNERPIKDRRHNLSRSYDERNKRKSTDLYLRPESQGMWELGVILRIPIEVTIQVKEMSDIPTTQI